VLRQEKIMPLRPIAFALVCFTLIWLTVPNLSAQGLPPIPTQIPAAKKVFLANAGSDERTPDDPEFSGGTERAFNEFYAAVKAKGRYAVVAAPADADLLLEIRFTIYPPQPFANRNTATGPHDDPQFRLELRDPKTNALLWTFIEHVQPALLQGNHDKNFDQALGRIVSDLQRLSSAAPVAPTQ
jgi:hypothetical protein